VEHQKEKLLNLQQKGIAFAVKHVILEAMDNRIQPQFSTEFP